MKSRLCPLLLATFICLLAPAEAVSQLGSAGQIVFVSDRDGNNEIYLMNADGTGLTNLTNHPTSDVNPTWSPDGSQLTFVSDRSGRRRVQQEWA